MTRAVFSSILVLFMGLLLSLSYLAFAGSEKSPISRSSPWDPSVKPVPRPRVSVTLSLERYVFWVNMMPGVDGQEQRHSFWAAFAIANNSGADIQFELISHCGEDKHIQFILQNVGGQVLWQHIWIDPLMKCPDYFETGVLPNNVKFLHRIEVPLVIEGKFLDPGEYLLKAFVDGYPRYGAYAPFLVDYAY